MLWRDEWYYVYRFPLAGLNGRDLYKIYKGRRWLSHISFHYAAFAIEGCLNAAMGVNLGIAKEIEL